MQQWRSCCRPGGSQSRKSLELRAQCEIQTLLGALTLALPMPLTFLSSTILGNWHYTELAFDLALAGTLCALVWRDVLGPGRGAILFGTLSGVALFNCFGSLIFLGALLPIAWAMRRLRWGLTEVALYGGSAAIGIGPLWLKLFAHTPYGAATLPGHGGTKVPPELLGVGIDVHKVGELVLDNGFSWGLHFRDALGTPEGTAFSMILATGVSIGLFVGWILLMVRVAPSLGRLARGALPVGGGATAQEVSPAVVPALMGAVYGVAWLLSDMSAPVLPWYLSNLREHGHLTLVPWVMVLGISTAVLIGSLIAEARDGTRHPGERALPRPALPLAAASLGWVLIASAIGVVGAVDSNAQPGLSSVFRGTCYDVQGVYMGPHIVGPSALGTDRAPVPVADYPDRARAFCAPHGLPAIDECMRGVFWSVGFDQAEATGGTLCLQLPSPWRQECLRGMGWAFQSMGEGGLVAAAPESERCDELTEAADQAACWRGVGFPLGDHLHNQPSKLMRALQDYPESVRGDIARGAATLVGRTYSSLSWMKAACQEWDQAYREPCLLGLEDSMGFRGDAAAVRAR